MSKAIKGIEDISSQILEVADFSNELTRFKREYLFSLAQEYCHGEIKDLERRF
jgi:hypothetical protein